MLHRFTEDDAATDEDILAFTPDRVREFVRSALGTDNRRFVASILISVLIAIANQRSAQQAREDLRQDLRDVEARLELVIDEQERDVTQFIAEALRHDHPRHGPSDHSP